ncbi:MAG: hypothetical protein ACOC2V_01425, partial [Alkalispirochaeta sp.]
GALVDIDGDTFRVQEINILSGQIRMFGPDGQYATLPVCAFERTGGAAQRGGGGNRRKSIEWTVNHGNCPAARIVTDTE